MQKSKVNIMHIILYDSDGIIHKKYVLQDKTVNGDHYLGVMKHLLTRISRVHPQYRKTVDRVCMIMLRLTMHHRE